LKDNHELLGYFLNHQKLIKGFVLIANVKAQQHMWVSGSEWTEEANSFHRCHQLLLSLWKPLDQQPVLCQIQ